MKFNEDVENSLYLLTAYGDGWIEINDNRLENSFILSTSILIESGLPPRFCQLETHHLATLFEQNTELILIGTGKSQQLPKPEIHQALVQQGKGFELMTTAAACRTYKILSAESRSVIALLFPA